MKAFKDAVALVTGAASGIGLGLAERFAAEGMHVVLVDIEQAALDAAEQQLGDALALGGGKAMTAVADVSDWAAMEALAETVKARFGGVDVLCNNAGVPGGRGPIWQKPVAQWQWVFGVNLMGVIHGIKAFVPDMIERGRPGHIVNTSSVYGLTTGLDTSDYGVSKHAVRRLTEGLYFELRAARAEHLGVSLLCPGLTATRIISGDRNRPDDLSEAASIDPDVQARIRAEESMYLQRGMSPSETADYVVRAMQERQFYVVTHPDHLKTMAAQVDDLVQGRSPRLPDHQLNWLDHWPLNTA